MKSIRDGKFKVFLVAICSDLAPEPARGDVETL